MFSTQASKKCANNLVTRYRGNRKAYPPRRPSQPISKRQIPSEHSTNSNQCKSAMTRIISSRFRPRRRSASHSWASLSRPRNLGMPVSRPMPSSVGECSRKQMTSATRTRMANTYRISALARQTLRTTASIRTLGANWCHRIRLLKIRTVSIRTALTSPRRTHSRHQTREAWSVCCRTEASSHPITTPPRSALSTSTDVPKRSSLLPIFTRRTIIRVNRIRRCRTS